jgi:hypothetical protein
VVQITVKAKPIELNAEIISAKAMLLFVPPQWGFDNWGFDANISFATSGDTLSKPSISSHISILSS